MSFSCLQPAFSNEVYDCFWTKLLEAVRACEAIKPEEENGTFTLTHEKNHILTGANCMEQIRPIPPP